MAIALLQAFKRGAYIALGLYVVFLGVLAVVSLNPQVAQLG